MRQTNPFATEIDTLRPGPGLTHYAAATFPTVQPAPWLTSHFAVGGWSPLRRLSGMLTAHMSQIAPRRGFNWHPHRGLEIFTYVIDGALYHEDTTGGSGVIEAGEVQRMFSGEFIQHKELNRGDAPTRVIQIWFAVDAAYRHLPPHYEQTPLAAMTPRPVGDGQARQIIGPEGATEAHVPARLTSTAVPGGGQTPISAPQPGEDLFLYVVNGEGELDDGGERRPLSLYDVILATPEMETAVIRAADPALTFLSFYLPPFI